MEVIPVSHSSERHILLTRDEKRILSFAFQLKENEERDTGVMSRFTHNMVEVCRSSPSQHILKLNMGPGYVHAGQAVHTLYSTLLHYAETVEQSQKLLEVHDRPRSEIMEQEKAIALGMVAVIAREMPTVQLAVQPPYVEDRN